MWLMGNWYDPEDLPSSGELLAEADDDRREAMNVCTYCGEDTSTCECSAP